MIKKILLVSGGLIVLIAAGFVIWVASYPELRKSKTAGGLPRMQSQYLTMRDGVRIAVDVWLPPDMEADDRVPTLVAGTRYSRGYSFAQALDFRSKMKIRLGQIDKRRVDMLELTSEAAWANEAGYAVVVVDARGSAASFGSRDIEWSPDEVADYGEVIAWIAGQSWSNGKVGAWGTSYPGNTAELMASTGQPAFLATAPRFSDFDPLMGVGMPGGLKADGFIQQWSALNAALDHNPAASRAVDSDRSGELLEEAIAGHNDLTIAEALSAIEYRDDEYGQSRLTMEAASPYSLRESIEAGNTPMQIWVSWLDAGTADGALSRYLTFSNPQQVLIGPWNHGGSASIDPFLYEHIEPADLDTEISNHEIIKPQMEQVLSFFDCYLKENTCPELESSITYYTLGSGEWQTTSVWPVEGFETQRLYFADGGTLSPESPSAEAAPDNYTVDFSASTGTTNRWMAQMGSAIDYTADRAAEDEKLLTYTSEPLRVDTEITGSPIVTLYVASTEADGAFHVYLEDVAPDGKVTYITEGILRAIHHPFSENEPPYVQLGSYRSFNRDDASPLVPGEVTEIEINLYATSVLVKAGHSLRIAIAGADADTFDRYPAEGTPVWTVYRDSIYPSSIALPMQEN